MSERPPEQPPTPGLWGAEGEVAGAQMGRPLKGTSRVIARCSWSLPLVLEVEPDHGGQPFPTLYYLTCPLARARTSRIEGAGGVREFTARLSADPAFAEAHAASDAAYAARRAELVPPGSPVAERLQGGVAGARGGIKCLHAHLAHHLAGGPNPVGSEVGLEVAPLECTEPCVREAARNPAWREPPQG